MKKTQFIIYGFYDNLCLKRKERKTASFCFLWDEVN
jgi:hypothetical protein